MGTLTVPTQIKIPSATIVKKAWDSMMTIYWVSNLTMLPLRT